MYDLRRNNAATASCFPHQCRLTEHHHGAMYTGTVSTATQTCTSGIGACRVLSSCNHLPHRSVTAWLRAQTVTSDGLKSMRGGMRPPTLSPGHGDGYICPSIHLPEGVGATEGDHHCLVCAEGVPDHIWDVAPLGDCVCRHMLLVMQRAAPPVQPHGSDW